jgi:hypothetical protein
VVQSVRDYGGVGFLDFATRTACCKEVIDVLNREINGALGTPEISKHTRATG